MVETVPPLLGAGTRFLVAGSLLLAFLSIRRGTRGVRITRANAGSALLVGTLLMGANAVISVAEKEVPSGLAALLVASIPLWVLLFRKLAREDVSPRSIGAVAVGFAGVGILMLPGGQTHDASTLALLATVGAAAMWGLGSFSSPRVKLPGDLLVSTGWQMLLGGVACTAAGLLAGEAGDVHPSAFSLDSILAWTYLVLIGSLVAFTAYAWLLKNVPVSKVATYAYVNPVVAIFLGWSILNEKITGHTLVGAAIIVVSVALVIRVESSRPRGTAARTASTARSESASA
jgi:drug/metabolite transporter (DMT)-like permease